MIEDQTERQLGETFTKGSSPDITGSPRKTQITSAKHGKAKSWVIF